MTAATRAARVGDPVRGSITWPCSLPSPSTNDLPPIPETEEEKKLYAIGLQVAGNTLATFKGEFSAAEVAMIAEGLFCEQMLGAGVTTPKMEQCLSLIQERLPNRNRVDYYYWYYGSLAMRQAQGQDWQNWNDKLKPILLRKQVLHGNNRGCWEAEGKWSKAAGRVVTTALAALSLEVYYRYLPLYSPEFSKAGE